MINIDFLRRNECQPLTQEQMTEIKSQFHPSNTANVNIVPYEIYDEDGVEQVVGEVRKTIDGVKKKKPRYRVVLLNQTIRNGVNNYDVSSLSIDRLYDCRYNTTKLNGSYHQRIFPDDEHEQYMVASDTLKIESKSSVTFTDVNIILEYTKTTDEWEEV